MGIVTIIFGETKRTRTLIAASMLSGVALLAVNFLYFVSDTSIFTTLNLIAALVIIGPSLLLRYREFQQLRGIEERFPDFLRDVTDAIRAGMMLPQAIKNTRRNNYGSLTPYVRKMIVQIDWGVPFEDVLIDFGNKTTKIMRRTVSTIIETHRSGGNIVDVFESVGKSMVQIDRIKKERAAHIYSQMITGYTIFFVFLGVMVGLQKFLLPSLSFVSGETGEVGGAVGTTTQLQVLYGQMFQWLIIIQGVFSGLAIGKMAEGSVVAGFKHSFVLTAIGYSVYAIAIGPI